MSAATTIAPEAAVTAATTLPGHPAPPATLTIFGAGGDLTKRLVVPALYNLVRAGKLPDDFAIIGVDHGDQTTEGWCQSLTEMMQALTRVGAREHQVEAIDEQVWSWLIGRMRYLRGDFTQPETYNQLGKLLMEPGRRQTDTANALFYLAVAERFFGPVIEQLGRAGLTRQSEPAWRRVIVEKPFGHDLASAEALNAQILKVLSEDQIYRIDHFLGKETVQNILVLRFANGIFEPLWNRDHIDHVQITAAETLGVEGRGRFYEKTGALRDMVPNHLFQLLAMIGMEPPISFDADAVRAKKTELFQAIHPISPADAVRGQYGAGVVLGKSIRDYRHEPDEGLSLSFSAKRPGAEIEIEGVEMNFAYQDYFAPLASVGYETLIYDCLIGDAILFQRADTVEAAWCAVQGLIDAWARAPADDFPNYAAGTAGPAAADRLLARAGHAWLPIKAHHPHGRSGGSSSAPAPASHSG